MNSQYKISLKKKLCEDICINGKSTIKTAKEYGVPLKTLEKWITAFNKIIIVLILKLRIMILKKLIRLFLMFPMMICLMKN